MPPKLKLNLNLDASDQSLPPHNNGALQVIWFSSLKAQYEWLCRLSPLLLLQPVFSMLEVPSEFSTSSLFVGKFAKKIFVQAPSIDLGPDGTLKIYKSYQEFEFNNGGMIAAARTSVSPLAAGAAAAAMQQYKVRVTQRFIHSLCWNVLLAMMKNWSSLVVIQIAESDVKIIRTVGQGASALVQKAFLPRESRFAAVKKISVLEREKRHQLMNDIKALCHAPNVPGLIRFYGAYHAADKGQIAVVLEYMDGGSLADVLFKVCLCLFNWMNSIQFTLTISYDMQLNDLQASLVSCQHMIGRTRNLLIGFCRWQKFQRVYWQQLQQRSCQH